MLLCRQSQRRRDPWQITMDGAGKSNMRRSSPRGEERFYRQWVPAEDMSTFEVHVEETDLFIAVSRTSDPLEMLREEALRAVERCREDIKAAISMDAGFGESLEPVEVPREAPRIARAMAEAGRAAGVGPMAAVAGAVAGEVGYRLLELVPEVIVENGGDIFFRTAGPTVVGLYAGRSPLTGRIGFRLGGGEEPLAVATSSGTVGHSLSLGKADAVTATSRSAPLADAVATAAGNMVQGPETIEAAMAFADSIRGILGVVVVVGERMGIRGEVEMVPVSVKQRGGKGK